MGQKETPPVYAKQAPSGQGSAPSSLEGFVLRLPRDFPASVAWWSNIAGGVDKMAQCQPGIRAVPRVSATQRGWVPALCSGVVSLPVRSPGLAPSSRPHRTQCWEKSGAGRAVAPAWLPLHAGQTRCPQRHQDLPAVPAHGAVLPLHLPWGDKHLFPSPCSGRATMPCFSSLSPFSLPLLPLLGLFSQTLFSFTLTSPSLVSHLVSPCVL